MALTKVALEIPRGQTRQLSKLGKEMFTGSVSFLHLFEIYWTGFCH